MDSRQPLPLEYKNRTQKMAVALRSNLNNRKQQQRLRQEQHTAFSPLQGAAPMNELIIDIYSEEIPARMQATIRDQYQALWEESLTNYAIVFSNLQVFSSVQRLLMTVIIAPTTAQRLEHKRGPRVGAPQHALNGFLTANNVTQQELVEKNGYWYIDKIIHPQASEELIPTLFQGIIAKIKWPKTMIWPQATIAWGRPVRRISAAYNNRPLIFPIEVFGLVSIGVATGHRFLAPQDFPISGIDQYRKNLKDHWVMVDHEERRNDILTQMDKLLKSKGLILKPGSDTLLEEVCDLVEYPFVGLGRIDDHYLSIPQEILTTSMRYHQKFFPLEVVFDTAAINRPVTNDKLVVNKVDQRPLASYFAFVSNVPINDEITQGCEKVLRARLEDAAFFFREDCRHPLDHFNQTLNNVMYHQKLGCIQQKVNRLMISASDEQVRACAALCKADLTTQMVGEFAELQGIVGRLYATHQGLPSIIAQALEEYYAPIGPTDQLPASWPAINLSVLDKLDTLTGFLGVGQHATGSKDPYGLRRAAYGIVRIMLEKPYPGYRLRPIINKLKQEYENQGITLNSDTTNMVIQWIHGRFIGYVQDHIKLPAINEVWNCLIQKGCDDDLYGLYQQLTALHQFKEDPQNLPILKAFKRLYGLASGETATFDPSLEQNLKPDTQLFTQAAEGALWSIASATLPTVLDHWSNHGNLAALSPLGNLVSPLNQFFDEVTVNDTDQKLRNNRLILINALVRSLNQIVNFELLHSF